MGAFTGILSGLLVLINVTFLAIGIVILAIAGIRGYFFELAIFIFIAGAILLSVNCIGGCCLGFRKKGTTATYGFLMILMIIAQVALIFVLIDNFGDLNDALDAFLKVTFDSAKKQDLNAMVFVNDVQYMFECCGVKSSLEYPISQVPESCCSGTGSTVKSFIESVIPACTFLTSYKTGCGEAMFPYMKMFGILIFSLESVATILAFTVAIIQKSARNREQQPIQLQYNYQRSVTSPRYSQI